MWNLHSSTITTLPWICSQSLNDMHLNTALYDYDSCLQCLVNVVIMATWVNTLPYSCHVVTCACMSVHICTHGIVYCFAWGLSSLGTPR